MGTFNKTTTGTFTVPSGTLANVQTNFFLRTQTGRRKIAKLGVSVLSAQTGVGFLVNFSSAGETYRQDEPFQNYAADLSVPPDQKLRTVDIPTEGANLDFGVKPNQDLTQDLTFQIVIEYGE